MSDYVAPVEEILFALDMAGLPDIAQMPLFTEATPDLIAAIVEEAGKFGAGVLAPTNTVGDHQGCTLEADGRVRLPEGAADAYAQFVEAGWPSLPFEADWGGQGLPAVVGAAVTEIWQAANMAWALGPLLTTGSIEALTAHGTDRQKALFLPKLVSGEWTGTMNLTEPQAGTDLAQLRCKAEPAPDLGEGLYRVYGQKIFITHGDHDMAENICHLVLARLPDAPPGVKGISLFLVPKVLVNDDGSLGARNDVKVVSLEHKLGIHGSPTAVMAFGDDTGAVGSLIGQPHKGLACMFTMMNHARLNIGIQGLGVADRALQHAAAYARERVQGVDVTNPKAGKTTIVHHPDVRRMLMTMRAKTEAARLLSYHAMARIDIARAHPDEAARQAAQARVDLLTPIVKGWASEVGFEVADLGVQVFGGTGYIEETGAAQFLRDARIARIYEGTNGIQALDLVGRKLLFDNGAAMTALIADMRATVSALKQGGEQGAEDVAALAAPLARAVDDLEGACAWILDHGDPVTAQAACTPLLFLAGITGGGWLLAAAALEARRRLDASKGDPGFLAAKITTARFMADAILPFTAAHRAAIQAGPDSLMALEEERF